jgi:Flp pilus assembly protein TadG
MNNQKRARNQRGQILLFVTFAAVPMFAIIGLVTDLGYMQYVKKSTQAAADAAARAAIIEFHKSNYGASYSCGGSVVCQAAPQYCDPTITTPSNAIENGCLYAKQNGFTHNSSQDVTYVSGTSASPPTVAGLSSASYWVTFRVTQVVPQLFSAAAGNMSGMVTSRATAAVTGSRDCIYALNPAAVGVSIGGTASLTSACGIYVDSSNAAAISTNGSAVLSAPEYNVVGNVSTHAPLTPAPNTGASPAADPLAALPAPAAPTYTCDYKNYNAPNWTNPTLSPGVYCGGIAVKNNNYTFLPGNYILVGGGLTTQDANSNIAGSGVMFYNTFGATDKGPQSYSPTNIAATSTVNLTAPTSGTYTGILFFDDRGAPTGNPDSYGGGSSAVYQGAIYNRNNGITMYGNSSVTAQYTILIADTITMIGTSGFNDNYTSLAGGSPIKQVSLVE